MSSSWTWKDDIELRKIVTPPNRKAGCRSEVETEIRDSLSDIVEWRRAIARQPAGVRHVESTTVHRAVDPARPETKPGRPADTERRSRREDRARSKRRRAESPRTGKEPPADDPETAGSL
jgi:hypothetical protein